MRRIVDIILALVCLVSVSCVENDVPYPYTPLEIISITGEGFTTSKNSNTRTVTLNLEETTDIQNVEIESVVYSDEATSVVYNRDITQPLDMGYPVKLSLGVYDQVYLWSIEGSQNIERSVTIEGQIGSAVIDVTNRCVYMDINEDRDKSNLNVTYVKLSSVNATYIPDLTSTTYDFSSGARSVEVTDYGRVESWRIYTEFVEATVEMPLCTLLATVAWVEASGDTSTGEECGFKYRKVGEAEEKYVVENPGSGTFSATITGLEPDTTYEIYSYIGDKTSPSQTHTTESIVQLDNRDFEEWHTDSWVRPYIYGEVDPVWDTGNEGASSGSATLTQGVTDPRPGSSGELSAELVAQNVGFLSITKFAAGNIFTGSFVDIENADGIIAFGYPFTQRPLGLKGWYKYTCGIIDEVGSNLPSDVEITKGVTPDYGVVYIALGTWEPKEYTAKDTYSANYKSPVYVYTGDTSSFFDPEGEEVVAYGKELIEESVTTWTEFNITLDYYDKTTSPTHIIIVGSTSFYGDYFTGSSSSRLWLDDLELVYE